MRLYPNMRLYLSVLPAFVVVYFGLPVLSLTGAPPSAQAGPPGVGVGFGHACVLSSDGAVRCWGAGAQGQLGVDDEASAAEPAAVSGGLSFHSLAVGHSHSCGVAQEGAVHCWGRNGYGELGDGSTGNRPHPVAVSGGMSFETVAAGTHHTCALTADGEAYCWGLNSSAQLGAAAGDPSLEPVQVQADARFESITAGVDHTCALASNGRATCWGSNDFGELGDSTRALGAAQPEEVPGNQYEAISAGSNRTCGVTSGGEAYCWGNNNYGALGDGTEESRAAPTEVSGDHRFAAISLGGVHTCALNRDGEAYCWGLNTFGQLGDGTTTSRLAPVAVAGGHVFDAISAGSYGTCAVTATEEVYCWGRVTGLAGLEEAEEVITEPAPVERASPPGDVPGGGADWAAAFFGAMAAQTAPPRTVQPGAPGSDTRVLAPGELDGTELPPHTEADVRFMRGMIPHHAQALEMTELLWDRSSSPRLRRLAQRIEISQKDEIALMERWLRERGEEASVAGVGHEHGTAGPPGEAGRHLMPGMLTPEEMAELRDAREEAFDRLFLEFMIRHHEGALVMVAELFSSPGAGQGSAIYQFASDVDADQEMEIRRMRAMLERND